MEIAVPSWLVSAIANSPLALAVLLAGWLADRFFRRQVRPLLLKFWADLCAKWNADRELAGKAAESRERLTLQIQRVADEMERDHGRGNGHVKNEHKP